MKSGAILGACFLACLHFVGCGFKTKTPPNLTADGWTVEGNAFQVVLDKPPAAAIPLKLDLGNVANSGDATINAVIRNSGTTAIPSGSIVQEKGDIKICSCDGTNLNLGSLDPGACVKIIAAPTKTAANGQGSTFRMSGLLDMNIAATLPDSAPVSDGGLTISASCD